MPDFVTSTPFLVVTGVVILILLIAFVSSRYHVAGANEALIVAGSRGAKVRDERGQVVASPGDKGVKVVVGGGTFVRPLLDRVGKLKLTARQISVQLADAVTSQGIKVQVQGVATFKIGRDVESLRNAAERFLDAKPEQVDSIVKNVLEGSLRSIVGTLTIEELIRDRQKLLQQVQDAAKGDLATSGLQIDAFTIQSFSDESNYIELLGQQSVATVSRDARMAKASTDQEAAVREAEAQQIKINAARDVSLREAETRTQVQAAQARADQPHRLPDRPERRRGLGQRAQRNAGHDRIHDGGQGADRARCPQPGRRRAGPWVRRAAAHRRRQRRRHDRVGRGPDQ